MLARGNESVKEALSAHTMINTCQICEIGNDFTQFAKLNRYSKVLRIKSSVNLPLFCSSFGYFSTLLSTMRYPPPC